MAAAVLMLRDATPDTVLTGPIARGDAGSIRRHLEVLLNDPAALDVYLALSRAALPLAAEQGAPSEQLMAIEAVLDGVLAQSDARAEP
jgi:predicted short-subunit dehydrogenase-like oxidoreductase (DUF2520 family)